MNIQYHGKCFSFADIENTNTQSDCLHDKPASTQDVVSQKDGYLFFKNLQNGDVITLELDMSIHSIYANPNISDCRGKCAFMAGPLVYCVEDCDNGDIDKYVVNRPLILENTQKANTTQTFEHERYLPDIIPLEQIYHEILGTTRMARIPAYQLNTTDELYSTKEPSYTPSTLNAIPYYLWGNRTEGKMRVWLS